MVRLGKVAFLNCVPLYHALERGETPDGLRVTIVSASPVELTALLLAGELDLGPMPLADYARHPERFLVLPDLSISSDGPAGSILLVANRPLPRGKVTVALPDDSSTSSLLLRLLAPDVLPKREVTWVVRAPDATAMLEQADAALLIGDRALRASVEHPDWVLADLGKVWKRRTGLPMVFAVFAIRRKLAGAAWITPLRDSLVRAGRHAAQDMDAVLAAAGTGHGLTAERLKWYFSILRYELGPRFVTGAERFLADGRSLGGFTATHLEIWSTGATSAGSGPNSRGKATKAGTP